MQVVQDSSHFYKPPSFHGDSLTALAQLRVVCTFQYPRRFLAHRQPLLPLGSQGNSSKISQGLCKKAGNLQKAQLTMNLSLSSERKKKSSSGTDWKDNSTVPPSLEQLETTFRDVQAEMGADQSRYHPPGYIMRIKLHFLKMNFSPFNV